MKSGGGRFTQSDERKSSGRAAAEARAIEALGFLAGEPERIGRFLDVSGLTLQTLRESAKNPGFLAAVLDYVAADPALLNAFAAHSGHDAAAIDRARGILAGPPAWDGA